MNSRIFYRNCALHIKCKKKYFFFFSTDKWQDNWLYSEHPGKEFGKFELTAGKFYNDAEADKGEI